MVCTLANMAAEVFFVNGLGLVTRALPSVVPRLAWLILLRSGRVERSCVRYHVTRGTEIEVDDECLCTLPNFVIVTVYPKENFDIKLS